MLDNQTQIVDLLRELLQQLLMPTPATPTIEQMLHHCLYMLESTSSQTFLKGLVLHYIKHGKLSDKQLLSLQETYRSCHL